MASEYFILPMLPATAPTRRARVTGLTADRSADFLSTALSWDAVSNAKEYKVYRADSFRDDAAWSLLATKTAPTVTHNDSGETATNDYAFKVSAVLNGWESEGPISEPAYSQGQDGEL